MDRDCITIAMPKGRLGDITAELLEKAGVDISVLKEDSRKLYFVSPDQSVRFFLAKPSDVPIYVAYGAADIGFAGKDTLLEERQNLYEVLDLGIGVCNMVVAGPKELEGKLDSLVNKRIATKYPRIAKEYFEHKKHESVEIIKLSGSVEIAPLVGLSEVIVDIVESGKTLEENGLVVLEHITKLSARMVVNRVSMKMKQAPIRNLIERLETVLKNRKDA